MRKLILPIVLALAVISATTARGAIQDHDWCRITTSDFDLVRDLSSHAATALAQQMTRFARATDCLAPRDAAYMLASAAAITGNDRYAKKLFRQMLAEKPDDIDALVGLSLVSEDRGPALDADHAGAKCPHGGTHER